MPLVYSDVINTHAKRILLANKMLVAAVSMRMATGSVGWDQLGAGPTVTASVTQELNGRSISKA